jgi:hypothetical protein
LTVANDIINPFCETTLGAGDAFSEGTSKNSTSSVPSFGTFKAFGVSGLGLRIQRFGLRVGDWRFGLRVEDLAIRVRG